MTTQHFINLLVAEYPQHKEAIETSGEAYSAAEYASTAYAEHYNGDEPLAVVEWIFECEWDCGFEEWFDEVAPTFEDD